MPRVRPVSYTHLDVYKRQASDSAQRYFADGNNEFPVVKGVAPHAVLTSMGSFKSEAVPIAKVGANTAQVQQMLDRAGFK